MKSVDARRRDLEKKRRKIDLQVERDHQKIDRKADRQRENIETRLADLDERQKRAMDAVSRAADQWGYTLDELAAASAKARRGRKKGGRKGAAKSKAVAKYRNPDNSSETWSGRGRSPAWMIAAERRGIPRSRLAIPQTGGASAAPAKATNTARAKTAKTSAGKGATAAKKRAGAAKGRMAAKYRNPNDSSQTWSGQGRRPGWILDAERRGIPRSQFAIRGGAASSATAPAKPKKAAAKKGKAATKSKVPAKYRNPDNSSETWSGRGRSPKWFESAVRRGIPRSRLEI